MLELFQYSFDEGRANVADQELTIESLVDFGKVAELDKLGIEKMDEYNELGFLDLSGRMVDAGKQDKAKEIYLKNANRRWNDVDAVSSQIAKQFDNALATIDQKMQSIEKEKEYFDFSQFAINPTLANIAATMLTNTPHVALAQVKAALDSGNVETLFTWYISVSSASQSIRNGSNRGMFKDAFSNPVGYTPNKQELPELTELRSLLKAWYENTVSEHENAKKTKKARLDQLFILRSSVSLRKREWLARYKRSNTHNAVLGIQAEPDRHFKVRF